MSCANNGLPCDDFNQDGNHDIFDILGMVRCVLIGWSDDTACTGTVPEEGPLWETGGEAASKEKAAKGDGEGLSG